ncbi:MAG: hypothetical protein KUG77_06505 [Nannocystaceae bacterium]|nr:hypothetical protein [Nannocystaceae bacterium]
MNDTNPTPPANSNLPGSDGDLADRFRVYCENYSEQTRLVEVEGIELLVSPRVYLAEGASTTLTLLSALGDPHGKHVLDMGCGTGILLSLIHI